MKAQNDGAFGHTVWAEPVLVQGVGVPPIGEEMVDANGKRVTSVDGRKEWYTLNAPITNAVTYRYQESVSGAFELDGPYPGDKYYVKITASGYRTKEMYLDISEGSENLVIWSILPTAAEVPDADYSGSVSGTANGADRVELLDGNGDRRYIADIRGDLFSFQDVLLGHYIMRSTISDFVEMQVLEVDGDIDIDVEWSSGSSAIRGVVVDAISGQAISNARVELIRCLSARPQVGVGDVTVYDGDTEVEVDSVDSESGLVVLKEAPTNVPTAVYYYLSGDVFAESSMAVI